MALGVPGLGGGWREGSPDSTFGFHLSGAGGEPENPLAEPAGDSWVTGPLERERLTEQRGRPRGWTVKELLPVFCRKSLRRAPGPEVPSRCAGSQQAERWPARGATGTGETGSAGWLASTGGAGANDRLVGARVAAGADATGSSGSAGRERSGLPRQRGAAGESNFSSRRLTRPGCGASYTTTSAAQMPGARGTAGGKPGADSMMRMLSARMVRTPGTRRYSSSSCCAGRASRRRSDSSRMNGFSLSGPRLSASTSRSFGPSGAAPGPGPPLRAANLARLRSRISRFHAGIAVRGPGPGRPRPAMLRTRPPTGLHRRPRAGWTLRLPASGPRRATPTSVAANWVSALGPKGRAAHL